MEVTVTIPGYMLIADIPTIYIFYCFFPSNNILAVYIVGEKIFLPYFHYLFHREEFRPNIPASDFPIPSQRGKLGYLASW